jgi:hypothetical protein
MARSRDAGPQARNDAYTALLALSFVAMATSSTLLYLDYSQYPTSNPPKVTSTITTPTDGGAPADAVGGNPLGGGAAPAAPAAPADNQGTMAPPAKPVVAQPVSFRLPEVLPPIK